MALHSRMAYNVACKKYCILLGTLLMLCRLHSAEARIGYFWHITDLHLDTIYSTQGDVMRSCWHIERQPQSANTIAPGYYGDYLCDSPWSLIESAAKAMKSRQGDNVEFVLWTGDGLSHSAHPMFDSKKLEILRNITELLGRTFSSQFIFPVLGHEDGSLSNLRHMGELWRHWLPTEALHTFEKGGYYSIEQTKSRLRIIALNTNFMRHDPKYSQSHSAAVRQHTRDYKSYYHHQHQHGHMGDWSRANAPHAADNLPHGEVTIGGERVSALTENENQDTEKQWLWLEDVLSMSKHNKETVYIVGHIPPGSDERHIGPQQNGHMTFTDGNNKRYVELVRKYASIIQGQFFGHLHSDSFRIIYDTKGKPVSWMMISPSVTPRKISIGSNNPAMRLYKFDTDSGQVLDYTQYYLDLKLANQVGEPNWVPEYNLTHYYALSDISAISLHNFVDRFTSNDASWFAKYYRANSVRHQNEPCEGICMLNHYCAITRVDYKEFRQCLEKERSALRSHAAASPNAVGRYSPPLLLLVTAAHVLQYFRAHSTQLPTFVASQLTAHSRRTERALTLLTAALAAFTALARRWLISTSMCLLSSLAKLKSAFMHFGLTPRAWLRLPCLLYEANSTRKGRLQPEQQQQQQHRKEHQLKQQQQQQQQQQHVKVKTSHVQCQQSLSTSIDMATNAAAVALAVAVAVAEADNTVNVIVTAAAAGAT